jgi:pimeloyl-ACP methyl ester carboxylesterase
LALGERALSFAMHRRLFPLLLLLALPAQSAPGRTDEVAAEYRRLEKLPPDATASPATHERIRLRGSAAALEKRWEDGIAAAELHLLGTGEDRAFRAARAAWRYLAGAPEAERRQALRVFNLACTACASTADWGKRVWTVAGVQVRLERRGFLAEPFARVVPSFLQDVKGFPTRTVTNGIGGAVHVVMPRTKRRDADWPYLPPVDYAYPASAVLRFDGDQPRLVLLDPQAEPSTELFGRAFALHADLTAPIAAMAAQSDQDDAAEQGARRPRLDLEALFVLEPPRDDRIPVLFIHGLESSAAAFRGMVAALRADPEIRRRFQFVAYQYPTGYPLALLNARLRKVMPAFWKWFDARAPEARSRGYIGVGHSMGGLQLKSLAMSSGRAVWDLCFMVPPDKVDLTGQLGELVRRLTLFEPDPKLKRLVFLAVPHRGSPWATGFAGAFGRGQVVEDPLVGDLREEILLRFGEQLRPEFRKRLAAPRTSIDNLSPDAPFLQALSGLEFRKGLPYHSIIGDYAGRKEGDGVVPFESAHLDGAASELVLKSGHSVQRTPEAIAEVKRILLLHLAEAGK